MVVLGFLLSLGSSALLGPGWVWMPHSSTRAGEGSSPGEGRWVEVGPSGLPAQVQCPRLGLTSFNGSQLQVAE